MNWKILAGCFILVAGAGCEQKKQPVVVAEETFVQSDLSRIGKVRLSEYGLFKGPMKNLEPAPGVIPYDVNAALFSDYAYKKRFIRIPRSEKAVYNPDEVFTFPEGTILIKNFYYPLDFGNDEKEIRIIETRLLICKNKVWETLVYCWDEAQSEAYLTLAGKNIQVNWKHYDGSDRVVSYSVPTMNQCKGCHLKGDKVLPLGPSARQLNGNFHYGTEMQNQLVHWMNAGLLEGLPDLNKVPALASYDNKNESIERRARAWLEVNCAHCHRPDGPAKGSGLHLLSSETNSAVLGIGKAPVAAGKGSGGRLFGIVPGYPDQSILQFRIESTHPGIMMPELGRKLVHEEGVALVREWIAAMK